MSNVNNLVPELRFSEYFSNWKSSQLVDVADFIDSLHETPKQYVELGFPMIRVSDVKDSGFNLNTCFRVTEDVHLHFTKRYSPKKGDIVFSRVGTCGENILIDFEQDVCIGQNTVLLKPKINSEFLSYYLKSNQIKRQVNNQVVGSSHKTISLKDIKKFNVFLPCPAEKKKIASFLLTVDELLTVQANKLEAFKSHKKGLMQQLFPLGNEATPELRFPEFKNITAWKKKPFSKLFEIGGGKDHKHLSDGDIPIYGSGGYMRSVDEYLYEGESACIGRKGTINKPMLLTGKFWTVDTLFYTHSFKGCLPKFIFLLFQNINWLTLNEAGGVPSLSKVIINKVEVMIPGIHEQQKIVDCIFLLDEIIEQQKNKIEALNKHKKGLMQQLFPSTENL